MVIFREVSIIYEKKFPVPEEWEENALTVEVDNSRLPNSRWYTGSGS